MQLLAGGLADSLSPQTMFQVFGSNVSETCVYGFFVVVAVSICAALLRIFYIPKFELVPKKLQIILEHIVLKFDGNAKSSTGRFSKFLGPYTVGISCYILFGVLIEMLGFRPIFADVNTCIAYCIVTAIIIPFCGIKKKGVKGRVKQYTSKPVYLIFNFLMADILAPIVMSYTLYTCITSGMIFMSFIYSVPFLNYVVPGLAAVVLVVAHAYFQSIIYSTLTLAFVNEAIE